MLRQLVLAQIPLDFRDRASTGRCGPARGPAVEGAQGSGEHKEVFEVCAREGSSGKGESNIQPARPSTGENRLVIRCYPLVHKYLIPHAHLIYIEVASRRVFAGKGFVVIADHSND